MASRLYGTTRRLYAQVVLILGRLRVFAIGSPSFAVLVALYVTGLIFLDVRQMQTRVTRFLPGRCHDALNRLLAVMPFSTRSLMALMIGHIRRQGIEGYLCLDDVVLQKAFAKKLRWAPWTYSFAEKRKVYGLHIVVLLWCSFDGRWRIPVAFRLWRPKRSCSKAGYRTKLQLAECMLKDVLSQGLHCRYIAFDGHYTAGWFTKLVGLLGLVWVGTLDPRTIVVFRGHRQAVSELGSKLHLRWRKSLNLRAVGLTVYAPKYGVLRLVVTRNRHGNYEYIVSDESVGAIKERWQLETTRNGESPPPSLKACPPHLRVTA